MIHKWNLKFAALALAALSQSLAPALATAAIVYTEDFPNTVIPVGNQPMSSVGWQAHLGPTAADHTGLNTTMLIATAAGIGGPVGYAGETSTSGTSYGLFWTTEPGTIALANLQNFSLYSNNASATDGLRIALRLDNNTPGNAADDIWVAANTPFVRNSATAGSVSNFVTNGELETLAFTTAASAWRDMTFTPGSTLSLAAVARGSDLPAGSINAAGVFYSAATVSSGNAGVIRFDAFTIEAIPEPSTYALGGAALVGLLSWKRRRRRLVSFTG
jgi:hypothetical protein